MNVLVDIFFKSKENAVKSIQKLTSTCVKVHNMIVELFLMSHIPSRHDQYIVS